MRQLSDASAWGYCGFSILTAVFACALFSLLCVGNHDMGEPGAKLTAENRKTSLFNKYFPSTRFEREPSFGGSMDNTNDNSCHFFEAGGMKFMVISLEFGPSDDVLDWANKKVSEHGDKRVIVLTHSYLFCNGERIGPQTPEAYIYPDVNHCYSSRHCYGIKGNDGQEIWDKFVKRHQNICFVLCGHVAGLTPSQPKPEARLSSFGVNGNLVHQILSNYQFFPNGGNGWLKIIKFLPADNKICVKTYSPLLKAFRTDSESQYELPYFMSAPLLSNASQVL